MAFSFDETYLVGLRSRNPETESHLVGFFSKPLKVKLRARLHSADLVEEVCQETFLRVLKYFQSGKELERPERLPAFIHGVCSNVMLELLRAHHRHDQFSPGDEEPLDPADPEAQAVTAERKLLVARVLAEMPVRDQELLRLVFLEEQDRDDVCRKLGVHRDYLRVLLHRSKTRFKEVLEDSQSARRRAAARASGETDVL